MFSQKLPGYVAAILFASSVLAAPTRRTTTTYSTITGWFMQDEASTDSSAFDFKTVNFGLLPQSNKAADQTDWEYFAAQVDQMNAGADSSTSYRVLLMGRHGEGVHNVAQEYYGDVLWDGHWSEKNGNGTVTWFDAHLTDNGVQQAITNSVFLNNSIKTAGMPAPQSFYVSPLYRTCNTAGLEWSDVALPESSPFVPTIKEKLREQLGVATCDKRSNATFIQDSFPSYSVEAGFTEEDELWKAYWLELDSQIDTRMHELLDDVFSNDKSTWISFTSHTGAISSLLRVMGHRKFSPGTADIIPVLVKATTS